MNEQIEIKEIKANEFNENIKQQLIQLLIDCTEFGDLGFKHPLSHDLSTRYWNKIEGELNDKDECRSLLIAVINNNTNNEAASSVDEAELQQQKQKQYTIVGTIQISWDLLYDVISHRAEVQKLMVKQSHTGKGISKSLLYQIEKKALEKGKTYLILDTNSTHKFSSKLYESVGYTLCGQMPNNTNYNNTYSITNHFYKILNNDK